MKLSAQFAVFRSKNYSYYSIGNVISLTGGWIQRIALAWLVWELTESPFWLGLVAASGLVPVVFIGPVGGALADRFSQVKLIATTQIAACALMFALYAVYTLDLLTLPVIIAFRFALSAILSISQPTRLALIPQLVKPELLTPAISFGAITFSVARFTGPALAGLVLTMGGFGAAFLINAVSYLAMLTAILLIDIPERQRSNRPSNSSVIKDIGAAYRYIHGHRGIWPVFVLFFFIVVAARPIGEILPAFVDQVFERDVSGLAILTAAMAIGSILGSLWVGQQKLGGLTQTVIIAGALNAAAVSIFVWIPTFWLAVPVIMLSSTFTLICGVSSQTLVQSNVDEAIRGRVMGLWFVLMRAGPPFGALLMGGLTEVFGLSLPFTLAGLVLVTVCWAAWRRRNSMALHLEQPRDVTSKPTPQYTHQK